MGGVKAVLGVVALGGVLFGATAAFGASAPMVGGVIQVWVTPSPNAGSGSGGQVLMTGAIADFGKTQSVNASGKPIPTKSGYKELVLKRGTIIISLVKFNAALKNANPTMFNRSDCSGYFAISAPASILSGTGAYAGITGTLHFSADNAFLLPKTKTGSCNQNANPMNSYLSVNGTGTVKFG
jgi:hypothetical protein